MTPSDQDHEPAYFQARHIRLACTHCGETAAEFALLPASTEPPSAPDGVLSQSVRLIRSGFMGHITLIGEVAALRRFIEAVTSRDFQAAAQVIPDMLGFYCPPCEAIYCERCWTIGLPMFDKEFENFYDYTRGTCPNGHEQMVDD